MTPKKETLLEQRKQMKKKRPSFRRVESWRYTRVKNPWRRPIGIDSQTRKKEKSGVKAPGIGYRSPKAVRGLHPSGYEEVRVITIDDLKGLSPKKHALKLARTLGSRKRIALIDYAQSKGFKILNLGITQKELEELEALAETDLSEYDDLDDFEDSFEEDER